MNTLRVGRVLAHGAEGLLERLEKRFNLARGGWEPLRLTSPPPLPQCTLICSNATPKVASLVAHTALRRNMREAKALGADRMLLQRGLLQRCTASGCPQLSGAPQPRVPTMQRVLAAAPPPWPQSPPCMHPSTLP